MTTLLYFHQLGRTSYCRKKVRCRHLRNDDINYVRHGGHDLYSRCSKRWRKQSRSTFMSSPFLQKTIIVIDDFLTRTLWYAQKFLLIKFLKWFKTKLIGNLSDLWTFCNPIRFLCTVTFIWFRYYSYNTRYRLFLCGIHNFNRIPRIFQATAYIFIFSFFIKCKK